MRILPETIKAVLEQDWAETHDLIELTIPEQEDPAYPEVTLYLATADNIWIGGNYYNPVINKIESIKFSKGRSPDNAEVVIENVSRVFGFLLTDTQRGIDGAKAVIKKAFKIHDGSYEAYPLFIGYVRDVRVDETQLEISIVSDMSRAGTTVAGRTITQRCIWIFKDKNCGWTIAQTGDPVFCDYGVDTPKGCKSHSNLHRFGGVPAFTALNSGNGYDPNNGWPIDPDRTGWCVTPDTQILCINELGQEYWRQAKDVKAGDYLVSVSKFNALVKTKVIEVARGETTRIYNFTTENGVSLSCSPTHPIMEAANKNEGKPAYLIKKGDEILTFKDRIETSKIDTITVNETPSEVYIFRLEEPYHTYITGDKKVGGIVSHNLKPILPYQNTV